MEHSAGAPFRISWGAVIGGLATAFGVWTLLYVLGLALGFSSLDLDRPNLARAMGIGGGIWVGLTGFLSMLVGGVITARSAGYVDRGNGALHGLVLWGASGVAAALAGALIMGSAASSMARMGSDAASKAMDALSANVDTQALLAPLNAKLEQAGKPALERGQLEAISRDAVSDSVKQGRFDRETFIGNVAANTNLSRTEVRNLYGTTIMQIETRAVELKEQAKQAAESASAATGRALWGLFALMVLSLLGAVTGASTGVSSLQRAHSSPWNEPVVVQQPIEVVR